MPAMIGGLGRMVSGASDSGYSWTNTITHDEVTGRMTGAWITELYGTNSKQETM